MDGTPGDKALPAAGRGKPVGRGAKMRAVARGDHLDQRQAQINASQVGNYIGRPTVLSDVARQSQFSDHLTCNQKSVYTN